MAFPWTEVATVATAAGAGAAWLAASASRQAVARANRPFVWPEFSWGYSDDYETFDVRVRLHNDGPGVALDVRWSLALIHGPEYEEEQEASERERELASPVIRAMRPGESVPSIQSERYLTKSIPAEQILGEEGWLTVRFTDSAGVRWEFAEDSAETELARPVRRLRQVRRDR